MRSHPMNPKGKTSSRNVTPQQATFELKQRVVLALNKIADRDTYQIGLEELEKVARTLTPECISPFLSCITDTDSEQKSAVRKECIRAMGTLARFHGSLMAPHLGKMVGSIIKRLKDSDSVVRDACVETMGILTMSIGCSGGGDSVFVGLVRPFFEALGEQNRYVQAGSALCLARVIDEACEPPRMLLSQMLARVVKFLKNQHFMGKPAIIELIRSIVQAGGAATEHALSLAVTNILEALKCTDWTTRKAASTALAAISVSNGGSLGFLKVACIRSLESCRFDKVKPVRDAVVHALHCWKALRGNDSSEPSEAGSSTKENIHGDYADSAYTGDSGWRESSSRKTSVVSASTGSSIGSTKKKMPLSTRKISPSYMDNHHLKNSNDCNIEISLPKACIAPSRVDAHKAPLQCTIVHNLQSVEGTRRCNDTMQECETTDDKPDCSSTSDIISVSCETKHIAINHEYFNDGDSASVFDMSGEPVAEEVGFEGFRTREHRSVDSTVMDTSVMDTCSNLTRICCENAANELAFIRKKLVDIANKQSKLLELIQAFMGNTISDLSNLHVKVHNMEDAVDQITQIVVQNGSCLNLVDSKHVKKNLSLSSSPRFSACTPRPSVDAVILQHSKTSLHKMQSCGEQSLSRSRSSSSIKEGLEAWTDPTSKIGKNSQGMVIKEKSGRKAKADDNQLCLSNLSLGSMQTEFENKSVFWKRIREMVCVGGVESAYEEVLCSGDDAKMLELMDRTGPVLEKLSSEAANEVVCTLIRMFRKQRFRSSMIPWLQQVVDLSCLHTPKQPFLSGKIQMEFLFALKSMTEMKYIGSGDRISIAQFAAKLSKEWAETPTRRIPLPRACSGVE
ncbi:Microtubule-associated protein SPIRAL2-like [Apostasia shenzhenica]|uniref:Microtubule-associated protein SPIRAL2-like n=1 Tax=Apostasia shenzhenica TaxID=1088818 RepID=A0A2I0ABJ2_9ASPA|nr:Microtubule-associated protein SPIRAL2-like [Apostasia shenzhenica]